MFPPTECELCGTLGDTPDCPYCERARAMLAQARDDNAAHPIGVQHHQTRLIAQTLACHDRAHDELHDWRTGKRHSTLGQIGGTPVPKQDLARQLDAGVVLIVALAKMLGLGMDRGTVEDFLKLEANRG